MKIRTLLASILLLFGLQLPTEAASSLVVTTWGHVTTLTSNPGTGYSDGYSFFVSSDSRFIRFIVTKDQGELWGILLGVPQGQTLANGLYMSTTDTFDASPSMMGAGFSIAGSDPETGALTGANTTQGEFTLSDLQWGPNGVSAVTVRFGVHANGHQYGELRFNTAETQQVPEPTTGCIALAAGFITLLRRRCK